MIPKLKQAIALLKKSKQLRTEQESKVLSDYLRTFEYFDVVKYSLDFNQKILECAKLIQYKHFKAGETVFLKGSKELKFFLIFQGKVTILVDKNKKEAENEIQLRKIIEQAQYDLTRENAQLQEMAKRTLSKSNIELKHKYQLDLQNYLLSLNNPDILKNIGELGFLSLKQTCILGNQKSFGELSITTNQYRTASVFALTDLDLGFIEENEYKYLFKEQIEIGLFMVDTMKQLLGEEAQRSEIGEFSYYFKSRPIVYKKSIYIEGEPATSIFLIKQGQVELKFNTPDKNQVSLSIIGAGSFFGQEQGLELGKNRICSAHCISNDTFVCEVSLEKVLLPQFNKFFEILLTQAKRSSEWYNERKDQMMNRKTRKLSNSDNKKKQEKEKQEQIEAESARNSNSFLLAMMKMRESERLLRQASGLTVSVEKSLHQIKLQNHLESDSSPLSGNSSPKMGGGQQKKKSLTISKFGRQKTMEDIITTVMVEKQLQNENLETFCSSISFSKPEIKSNLNSPIKKIVMQDSNKNQFSYELTDFSSHLKRIDKSPKNFSKNDTTNINTSLIKPIQIVSIDNIPINQSESMLCSQQSIGNNTEKSGLDLSSDETLKLQDKKIKFTPKLFKKSSFSIQLKKGESQLQQSKSSQSSNQVPSKVLAADQCSQIENTNKDNNQIPPSIQFVINSNNIQCQNDMNNANKDCDWNSKHINSQSLSTKNRSDNNSYLNAFKGTKQIDQQLENYSNSYFISARGSSKVPYHQKTLSQTSISSHSQNKNIDNTSINEDHLSNEKIQSENKYFSYVNPTKRLVKEVIPSVNKSYGFNSYFENNLQKINGTFNDFSEEREAHESPLKIRRLANRKGQQNLPQEINEIKRKLKESMNIKTLPSDFSSPLENEVIQQQSQSPYLPQVPLLKLSSTHSRIFSPSKLSPQHYEFKGDDRHQQSQLPISLRIKGIGASNSKYLDTKQEAERIHKSLILKKKRSLNKNSSSENKKNNSSSIHFSNPNQQNSKIAPTNEREYSFPIEKQSILLNLKNQILTPSKTIPKLGQLKSNSVLFNFKAEKSSEEKAKEKVSSPNLFLSQDKIQPLFFTSRTVSNPKNMNSSDGVEMKCEVQTSSNSNNLPAKHDFYQSRIIKSFQDSQASEISQKKYKDLLSSKKYFNLNGKELNQQIFPVDRIPQPVPSLRSFVSSGPTLTQNNTSSGTNRLQFLAYPYF